MDGLNALYFAYLDATDAAFRAWTRYDADPGDSELHRLAYAAKDRRRDALSPLMRAVREAGHGGLADAARAGLGNEGN